MTPNAGQHTSMAKEVSSRHSIKDFSLSFSELSKNTFINDGIKAWNLAPIEIKNCLNYASAKNEIKKFVKKIPIWFFNLNAFLRLYKMHLPFNFLIDKSPVLI